MIHPTAVVEPGAVVGDGCRIWCFCHVRAGAVLGQGTSLGMGCYVAPSARIGAGCRVQNHVSVFDGVVLEDEVFVGPSAVFTNVIHPRAFVSRKHEYRETRVRRGSSIGANATIVAGVTIGAYALIGAGAVVTRDVPEFALMLGTPARQAGWVSKLGRRLEFDAAGRATCPEASDEYVLDGGRVRALR
ncbi:MAG: acyltransferase [Polyangiaceae bacterium]